MPNWKTHIEIGKELNKYLKYQQEDYNLFLFGNILPDINNCYVVTDVLEKIEHNITHFGKYNTPSYQEFYNKYKTEINNKEPLFLGYLIHLYTDYKWNKNFYEKVKHLRENTKNRDELRKSKQSDFKLYNNNFIKNYIVLNDIDVVAEKCKKINEVLIKQDDIQRVILFLLNQEYYKSEMKFHSFKEFDELKNNTIKEMNDYIKKLN